LCLALLLVLVLEVLALPLPLIAALRLPLVLQYHHLHSASRHQGWRPWLEMLRVQHLKLGCCYCCLHLQDYYCCCRRCHCCCFCSHLHYLLLDLQQLGLVLLLLLGKLLGMMQSVLLLVPQRYLHFQCLWQYLQLELQP
jgi:hypothetical protein